MSAYNIPSSSPRADSLDPFSHSNTPRAEGNPAPASWANEVSARLERLVPGKLDRLEKKGVAGATVLSNLVHHGTVPPDHAAFRDCVMLLCEYGESDSLKGLLQDSPFSELDFSGRNIKAKRLSCLASALEGNTKLTSLNFSGCKLDDAGAAAIANALRTMPGLIELNMSNNDIAHSGAEALSQAWQRHSTLRRLDLSGCKLGNTSAVFVSEALKCNTVLTQLDLSRNVVGSEGTRAIASALKENASLTSLNLDDNKFDARQGRHNLADAIEGENFTLRLFGSNDPKSESSVRQPYDQLGRILKSNRSPGLGQFMLCKASVRMSCENRLSGRWVEWAKLQAWKQALDNLFSRGLAPPDQEAFDACTQLLLRFPEIKYVAWFLQHSPYTGLNLNGKGPWNLEPHHLKDISQILKRNSRISRLDLSCNPHLTDNDMRLLAKALAVNSTLRILDLTSCGIGLPGKHFLADALSQGNQTLLSVTGPIGPLPEHERAAAPGEDHLDRLLRRNRNRAAAVIGGQRACAGAFLGQAASAASSGKLSAFHFSDQGAVMAGLLDPRTLSHLPQINKTTAATAQKFIEQARQDADR